MKPPSNWTKQTADSYSAPVPVPRAVAACDPKRDVFSDPRIGDVIAVSSGSRRPTKKTALKVEGSVVEYSYVDGRTRGNSCTNLDTWERYRSRAKVIHRADD